mmetsp:Transcript_56329/g.98898  ORF Transcript_56329/g.98898 Transcript_56329/m.98898 type:complete len:415 (+) Transcript_56329:1172-2416(+)
MYCCCCCRCCWYRYSCCACCWRCTSCCCFCKRSSCCFSSSACLRSASAFRFSSSALAFHARLILRNSSFSFCNVAALPGVVGAVIAAPAAIAAARVMCPEATGLASTGRVTSSGALLGVGAATAGRSHSQEIAWSMSVPYKEIACRQSASRKPIANKRSTISSRLDTLISAMGLMDRVSAAAEVPAPAAAAFFSFLFFFPFVALAGAAAGTTGAAAAAAAATDTPSVDGFLFPFVFAVVSVTAGATLLATDFAGVAVAAGFAAAFSLSFFFLAFLSVLGVAGTAMVDFAGVGTAVPTAVTSDTALALADAFPLLSSVFFGSFFALAACCCCCFSSSARLALFSASLFCLFRSIASCSSSTTACMFALFAALAALSFIFASSKGVWRLSVAMVTCTLAPCWANSRTASTSPRSTA